jgi:hypothetical protein
VLDILRIGAGLLDKIIPDPKLRYEAQQRMLELAQKGELAVLDAEKSIALAQIDVNKTEATSPDLFRGGWRPAVGWVCVLAIAYSFLLRPLLPWMVTVAGTTVPPLPPLDMVDLMTILGGILGLGGFRTYERVKGKA